MIRPLASTTAGASDGHGNSCTPSPLLISCNGYVEVFMRVATRAYSAQDEKEDERQHTRPDIPCQGRRQMPVIIRHSVVSGVDMQTECSLRQRHSSGRMEGWREPEPRSQSGGQEGESCEEKHGPGRSIVCCLLWFMHANCTPNANTHKH